MKFLIPTVLLAASTVSAACDGAPVLEQCLETTTETKNACTSTDYDCLCTAMKSVYGCFASSGCVDDDRSAPTNNEMQAYCAYVTTTTAAPVSSSAVSADSSEETSSATSTEESDSAATTGSSDSSGDDSNSGAYLAMNAGGMMVAIAGVVAAVL